MVEIKDILDGVLINLKEKFHNNLTALILYGSWAKGTARDDSDIDLLVVFKSISEDTRKILYKMERDTGIERSITFVIASVEDFQKEKVPLYTSVKNEGNVLWGNVGLSVSPLPPSTKYAEAFERSKEFETKKVEMAERILKEFPSYGSADLCFVASKHAIQMALAMKGKGYSSKVAVLLPLAEKHIGKEIAGKFRNLFNLYIKSEYGMEFLTPEEAKTAVDYAKEILDACYMP